MMKKKNYMYMHTINGKPARYESGEQIYYVNDLGKFIAKLVPSLYQIRKEQKLSNKWRNTKHFEPEFDYGYVRVELPE